MKKVSVASLRSKKIESLRSVKEELMGLCSCCNSFQNCTYPRILKRPVLQCEEFNGILPPPLKIVPKEKVFPRKVRKPHSRGLCGICEDRATCVYPKPEGGVWHCEDYR